MDYVYRRPFDMRTRAGLSLLMYVDAPPPPPGWAHNIGGVDNSAVFAIGGIPLANIAKVGGVS